MRNLNKLCEERAGVMLLYSIALAWVLLLSAPVWGWRMLRQGRYREGLRERLGAVPQRLQSYARGHDVVWVHAVSVGETLTAVRLIETLQQALPDYRIVISTTTPTGQQVARARFGADRVFFYPLDFAFATRAYLRVLRPRLLVLMESELWPRMLAECARAAVPVAVVNARVSDRSLPRYLALRWAWQPLLRKVSLLLTQSEGDAARWIRIGAPAARVRTTGNLKYDIAAVAESPFVALLRRHLPADVPVLLSASTHPGEEAVLLHCFRSMAAQKCVLLLAPRHPQRAAEVQHLARARGFAVLLLSEWRLAPGAIPASAVLLVDTVGELAPLFALARVAFVGGSLVPKGGHNPLEAARFGVPVVMGPHYQNFREMVQGMLAADAIRIVTEADVCHVLNELSAPGASSDLGERGRAFYASQAGATERTVAALLPLLAGGRA